MKKAGVEKLESNQLLSRARAQPNGALPQLVHEINVGELHQTERAGVGRIAAAVINNPRFLLFHVDD